MFPAALTGGGWLAKQRLLHFHSHESRGGCAGDPSSVRIRLAYSRRSKSTSAFNSPPRKELARDSTAIENVADCYGNFGCSLPDESVPSHDPPHARNRT